MVPAHRSQRYATMTRNQLVSVGQQEWPEVATTGARVGGARYILRRILGRGTCTQVWLAWDFKLERDVALKILPRSFLQDAQLLERLDEEVRRSARLAHPAIGRVYDFVCDYQAAAIATEYVDGWPLAVVKMDRPEKRFRIEDITLWVYQLCAALEYAHHEFCLVHRSLTPSNLLLNRREQLKVTDFGIDYAVGRFAAEHGNPASGAIAYMSPQQMQGTEASVLDDIYALGATIYDLVTGTPPFYQGDVREQILMLPAPAMNDRLVELGFDGVIPTAWEETVAACLAKDPGKRPQSANEVFSGLERRDKPQPMPNSRPTYGWDQKGSAEALSPGVGKLLKFLSKVQAWLAAKIPLQLQETLARAVAMAGPRAKEGLAALRGNPALVFALTMALVAVNLAIALWFFFRH